MIGEYAASMAACATLDAVKEAFGRAIAREGYSTSASRAWLAGAERTNSRAYFRNWTKEWAKLSDEKDFVSKSFVIAEARRRISPFTWLEAKQERPFSPS